MTWKVLYHTATEIIFQMEFSDPESVSATSFGKDVVTIDLKDIRIFKSKVSSKSISLDSFEGKP